VNAAFISAAVLTLAVVTSGCRTPAADPCPSSGLAVIVTVLDHTMWLCDRGHARARYRIALGRGGTGKRVEGDGKTPLGTYALGAPRPSARFGTFIPVAYPTEEQKRQGFTGRDVGIHGPDRRLRWAGGMNSWFDWTAGCIALGTDGELRQVATFVREQRPNISVRTVR
jgi:murein L,D-transpeptidase YafK